MGVKRKRVAFEENLLSISSIEVLRSWKNEESVARESLKAPTFWTSNKLMADG